MWKQVAIAGVCVLVAFYFLLRPSFVNGTVLEDGTAIQTHFGFCYHPLGAPLPIRSRLVPVDKEAIPIMDPAARGNDAWSCRLREGYVFGLFLPRRETIVVEVR